MPFATTCQAISTAILAVTIAVGSSVSAIVAVVFLFVFNTAFAIGRLAMIWLYPAEVVPLQIRAPGADLSTSVSWISTSWS